MSGADMQMKTLRDEIALRIDGGRPLAEVQAELIDGAADVHEDERAGLWLFAWSYARRPGRKPAGSVRLDRR